MIWNDSLVMATMPDYKGYFVNLGMVSWGAMLLVSLSGAFYMPLMKALKPKRWKIVHTGLTLLALTAGLAHGIVHLSLRLQAG